MMNLNDLNKYAGYIPPNLMNDHKLILGNLTKKLNELGLNNSQYSGSLKWALPQNDEMGRWLLNIKLNPEVEGFYPDLDNILNDMFHNSVNTEQFVDISIQ